MLKYGKLVRVGYFLNLACCSKEFKLISQPFVAKTFKKGYFLFTFI